MNEAEVQQVIRALQPYLIPMMDARIDQAEKTWIGRGTITSRDSTGPGALVTFDADSGAVPAKVLAHVHVNEGDRVTLIRSARTWLVVGAFARRQLSEASLRTSGPVVAGTHNTSTYVDLPQSPGIRLLKRYDLTAVRLAMTIGAYVTSAPTSIETAVRIVGTPGTETAGLFTPVDINISQLTYNVANSHQQITGWVRALSWPAGDFTITGRWRRGTGGGGTITQDSNDVVAMEADEIFRIDAV